MKLVTLTIVVTDRYDEAQLIAHITSHVGFRIPVVHRVRMLPSRLARKLRQMMDTIRDQLFDPAIKPHDAAAFIQGVKNHITLWSQPK